MLGSQPLDYYSFRTRSISKNLIFRALLSIVILASFAVARPAYPIDAIQPGKLTTISSFIADTATITSQRDRSDARALKAPNGNILLGTRNGFLLELDPTNLNRIVSKKKLAGGLSGALAKFTENGEARVVIGTGNGFHCFDAKGNELSRMTDFDDVLQSPPVVHDNQVFFASDGGLAYKLTKNLTLLRHGRGNPVGSLISNPALLTPEPTVIYGTERLDGGDSIYSVLYAGPRELMYFDLPRSVGAPTFTPLVLQARPGSSVDAVVLIQTDEGKLLFGNQHGLSKSKSPIDLHGEPTSPLVCIEDSLLFTVCVDSESHQAKTVLLSLSGQELSRNSIHALDHSMVDATPTSEATVFQDNKLGVLAIMGFSDKTIKVVEVRTGTVLATSSKTKRIVVAPPTSLGDGTFFVGEEEDGVSFRFHVLKFSANVK